MTGSAGLLAVAARLLLRLIDKLAFAALPRFVRLGRGAKGHALIGDRPLGFRILPWVLLFHESLARSGYASSLRLDRPTGSGR